MKHRLFVLLMLGLFWVVPVFSQAAEVVFNSENGVLFLHPDTYEVVELSVTEYLLSDADGNEIIIQLSINDSLMPGEVIDSVQGFAEMVVDSILADGIPADDVVIETIMVRENEAQSIRVNDGSESIALVFFVLDGTNIGLIGANAGTGDVTEIMLPEILRIADTIIVPEELDLASEVVEPAQADATPVVAGPLRPSEMPDGLIIMFNAGVQSQLALPEGWAFFSDDPVSEVAALFNEANPALSMIVTDFGTGSGVGLDFLRDIYATSLIEGAFENAAPDQVISDTIYTLDERPIEVYDGFGVEGSDFALGIYIVTLAENHFAIVQVQGTKADFPETISEDIFNVAATFTLLAPVQSVDASATEVPASVFSGDPLPFGPVTCTTRGYDVISEATPLALVQCPLDCTAATVWGTDTYTNDSSICVAAVHAGVTTTAGGDVLVALLPGEDRYTGAERNGVVTRDYGSWGASIAVAAPGALPQPEEEVISPVSGLVLQDVECRTQGREVLSSDEPAARVQCPADCGSNSVWGTDVYTDDSSICTAAVHAGEISLEGGIVRIELRDGQTSYEASERNGIESSSYGNWGGSFVFTEDVDN